MIESDSGGEGAVYATLSGRIDDTVVQKLFSYMAEAVAKRTPSIHLLIQSTGGVISDGIALYNYLKNLPIDITTYNAGTVQSIAVILFLAAKKRRAARTATFMLHKATFYSGEANTSVQLNAATQSLMVDDGRIEGILKEYIFMPSEKWNVHRFSDLFLTAQDALEYGLIDEIADFSPPAGAVLINL